MTVYVFHGPSVTSEEVAGLLPDAVSRPPVRHGDLLALDHRPGDVVLIIDGVFHATAPVRHKEILRLLAEGVTVLGAASMGALRAAELHPYGMRGVGRIFEMYRDGVIDGDDEVAVAHTSDDSRLLTVALVDVRGRGEEGVRAGVIGPTEAEELLRVARSIPYPHRTVGALSKAVADEADLSAEALEWWAEASGGTGLKHADALAGLRAVAKERVRGPARDAWLSDPWHTPQLREWEGRFRARGPEAEGVPFTAELQHQRLYDPGFPGRWRGFVLAWIAGEETGDVESLAKEAARARGLTPESLSPVQLGHWLTPAETGSLASTEQLLRLLVRSACLGMAGHPNFSDPAHAARLLNDRIDSATAVRTAWRLNETVARSAPHRSVIRLRPDLLVAHLAEWWGVPGVDGPTLDAAARDRGFSDVGSAVEAARAFYLHVSGVLDASRKGAERAVRSR